MNRKCKKTGIFIGLTMAVAGMTACGETEPEETPVVKEETAKPTETPAPTSTPTPTPTPIPEYVDYDYEEAGVTIEIVLLVNSNNLRKVDYFILVHYFMESL